MSSRVSLSDDTRLAQCRTIPSGEIDDELMALDAKRGEVLGLDKIGTEIWRMAAVSVSVAEMVDRLSKSYDADRETIRADLLPFLEELVEAGLLEVSR